MDISVVVAHILGIFLAVMGVSMFINSKGTVTVVEESLQSKSVLWMWGLLATMAGALILAFNNVWTSGLPLVVTIIGWLVLIKGAFILFVPGSAASFYRIFAKKSLVAFCGVIALIIGLVLLYR